MDSHLNATTRNASFIDADESHELLDMPLVAVVAWSLCALVEIVRTDWRQRREARASMSTLDLNHESGAALSSRAMARSACTGPRVDDGHRANLSAIESVRPWFAFCTIAPRHASRSRGSHERT